MQRPQKPRIVWVSRASVGLMLPLANRLDTACAPLALCGSIKQPPDKSDEFGGRGRVKLPRLDRAEGGRCEVLLKHAKTRCRETFCPASVVLFASLQASSSPPLPSPQ